MKRKFLVTVVLACVLLMLHISPLNAQGIQTNGPYGGVVQSTSVQKSGNTKIVIISNSDIVVSKIPASYPEAVRQNKKENTINESSSLSPFDWQLKFSAGNKVFKDISFANTQVGYIVTELGAVYKTINGGDNWVTVMDLGFPYYWYGVHALTVDTVVIAGFNNQGNIKSGVVRWSYNGGTTWSGDINLYIPYGVGWLSRIHFFDKNRGIVSAEFSGGMHYTTNGGKDSTDWTYVQVNSDLGWFAGNIDAIADGNVFTTGIHFAHSTNYGVSWTSGPSADNVFDGGVDFLDDNMLFGWTGGGQISSPVSGWTHRTTDGGSSWGPRQLTFPYPVRALKFFNQNTGLVAAGNLYNEAGGIYSTSDGGANWNLDISTSAEMFSFEYKSVSPDSIDVWCVGSTGGSTGFTGKLYKSRMQNLVGINLAGSEIPEAFKLYQNYPNPFNPSTKIKFNVAKLSDVKIVAYDVMGREVQTLVNESLKPGTYEASFDGSKLSSGVYFYKLITKEFSKTRRMLLVK
jgi:photosystem II stability/assembly factor-like uncharacterized protein